jgi:hypothetical protein
MVLKMSKNSARGLGCVPTMSAGVGPVVGLSPSPRAPCPSPSLILINLEKLKNKQNKIVCTVALKNNKRGLRNKSP